MCGIVGYTGQKSAQTVLFEGLTKLEYRGYDSCGIAIGNPNLIIQKDAVRVSELQGSLPKFPGTTGIGHTRWATHGEPSQKNAHPHIDCAGNIAVVHNGIITNYVQIKNRLIAEGHKFITETDTEVIPHLIEKYYRGNLEEAVKAALKELQGSYAIIVIKGNDPGLVFARKDSPLIIGIGDREFFLASDITAVLEYTNNIIYLEDGDSGYVTADNLKIKSSNREVNREPQKVDWTSQQAQKCGYEHYMLKEIHEQPRIVRESIIEILSLNGTNKLLLTEAEEKNLVILASGTSYHAALLAKYIAANLNIFPPRIEMASELNALRSRWHPSMAVCLSQSGETADTLKAMRRLKQEGSRIVAITNVLGSTASKVADHTIYTRAGPEISVAATKSFTSQLITLYALALKLADLDIGVQADLINELRQIPDKMQRVLNLEDLVTIQSEKLANYEHIYYIGRGMNYPIALEGALKMKEVSYIHAEAYAAGELKHGPFALLGRDTPVVAIIPEDSNYDAMLTTIKEIKARGALVFAIAGEDDEIIQDIVDFVIPVPVTNSLFSPLINVVAIQLLAYFTAKKLGCPIDFPRNLAKSVTVE